ncbi:MAG: RagB/SusD family nutrient uptake outer membrane protein [Bacteroidales bacterium]|nr:RagB/SusD family nutrient uptake outer membrane protein [Bacteroidales bacterium]
MKSKFIKYMISLLITMVILPVEQSCTNLDEEIYDQVPVEEFGQTQQQRNALIAPIYRSLKNIFPGDYFNMVETVSDMAVTPTRKGGDWWDGGQFKEFRLHRWSPSTSALTNSYNNFMSAVANCNMIYYMINTNEGISAEEKNAILAEVRAVRAFWYYMLIDNWGNVPITTDFLDKTKPATKSRTEVYNFIVTELNAVKDQLRDDVGLASYGKMTKGAAYTLLAKVYLNAEVWSGTPEWQNCIDACDVVMELPYILEPNWKTNFQVKNETSKEIIFPCVFSTADGGNHFAQRTLHYNDPIALGLNIGTWNGISAMPDYVKAFDADDKRLNGSFLIGPMNDPATGEVLKTAHGRDLIHTVDIAMTNIEDDWGEVEQEEGARINKWEFEPGQNGDAENDFAIFRLADVYLMKAEALVRLATDNETATDLVNEVRERAFDDPAKLYTSVTLEDIYKERRFEFAWECMTRQDMIRFGKFLDPIPVWKPYTSDSKYLLFPIPRTALEANEQLVQNPGY